MALAGHTPQVRWQDVGAFRRQQTEGPRQLVGGEPDAKVVLLATGQRIGAQAKPRARSRRGRASEWDVQQHLRLVSDALEGRSATSDGDTPPVSKKESS